MNSCAFLLTHSSKSSQITVDDWLPLMVTCPPELVTAYVGDLNYYIESSELSERRVFIKSFVKEIKVSKNGGLIRYIFPLPPDNHEEEGLGVLPIVRYSGAGGIRIVTFRVI
jgi:hypothetical protein